MSQVVRAPGGARRPILGLPRNVLLLALPAFIPVIILGVIPLVRGIGIGFTDAGSGDGTFNGIDNYVTLAGDRYFWQSLVVGAIWTLSVTGIQFLMSLSLALLLNEPLRGMGAARVLALLPWAIPPVVIGFIWRLVYHPTDGLLNTALLNLGLIDQPIGWLYSEQLALPAGIVAGVWAGMPATTLVLLAGLQSVSKELMEAAALDGAGAIRRFFTVTLPALAPTIVAITTLDLIWNFNGFGLIYVLTQGGPAGSTKLPMLYAYEEAFRYGNLGYAAAMGNVMVLILTAAIVLYLSRTLRATIGGPK